MGADLILSWFCVKDGTDLKKAQKDMIKAIQKRKEFKPSEIAEFLEMCNIEEEDEEGKRILTFAQIETRMIKVIKDTFESLTYRDVSSIYHKGETIFVTGGMSWGDDPTETFDTFNKFCALPKSILRAGGIR